MSDDWRAAFAEAGGVAVYDELLLPRIFQPLAEQLLDLAEVKPGERVLDVACGPGTVAVAAAERVGPTGRVTGCDLSPAMLALARAKSSSIEWLETSAAPLVGVPDAGFDVATCQQGLQFFPDREAAVAEMYRALAPGGRVVVAVWGSLERSPSYAALAAAIAEVVGEDAAARFRGGPWGMPDPDDLGALLRGAGFADVRLETRSVSGLFEGGPAQLAAPLVASPVADDVVALSEAEARELIEAAGRHAAVLIKDGVVHSTMETNVGLGVKP